MPGYNNIPGRTAARAASLAPVAAGCQPGTNTSDDAARFTPARSKGRLSRSHNSSRRSRGATCVVVSFRPAAEQPSRNQYACRGRSASHARPAAARCRCRSGRGHNPGPRIRADPAGGRAYRGLPAGPLPEGRRSRPSPSDALRAGGDTRRSAHAGYRDSRSGRDPARQRIDEGRCCARFQWRRP